MKFLILALAFVAAASAQHQQPIAILRQAQDISPEGSYNYAYETENGINAQESGQPGPVNAEGQAAIVAQGSFQYSAPDGTPISVSYVADENGFQPQGAHLPVAPPVPEGILRALEFIRSHPSEESRGNRPGPIPFPQPSRRF
ncbi:endocuticle structural glycoprotein SgAbd-8-like [Venturia canescens]|uniref:endocuticle structural glycoprotein SgAbd-8-like n=1 Tax=Venturia canescens TaxID=32260 RepID=UPI001C9D3DDE|nr:endocuticle structural glycoprotein SgAbd-8-like [Venturia canescens]